MIAFSSAMTAGLFIWAYAGIAADRATRPEAARKFLVRMERILVVSAEF
jgi:hypothetical protein